MDFKFISEAISKLNQFALKDAKYKTTADELIELLSKLEVDFSNYVNEHQNVVDQTVSAQNISKLAYKEKNDTLKENFTLYEDQVFNKIESFKRVKGESLTLIDNEFNATLEKLAYELSQNKTLLDEKQNETDINKNKEISYIDKQIIEIRKQSSKSIAQIEINFASDIEKIETKYREIEFNYVNIVKAFDEEILSKKISIQEAKNSYREQSDSKYLSIKNDYHKLSSAFNKKVDSIKKTRNDAYFKLQDKYTLDLKPYEESLISIENDYRNTIDIFQKEYNDTVEVHNLKKHQLIETFNQTKAKINKECNDSITLLNSKLSTFKEIVIKERTDGQKVHAQKLVGLSEQEIKDLNKERNKSLRVQDSELNKQIIRTQKENLTKNKHQYDLLLDAEIKYIEAMTNWRIEEKVLGLNFKLKSYHNYLNYQNKLKENEVEIKKLKLTFDHEVDILNFEQLETISPLETTLSIDNAISERDVNLLSNDTNYHLNHYQHKEDLLEYQQQIHKLEQLQILDIAKLNLENERNILSITQQLNIEKETVIREQQLKNQNLKRELIIKTSELNQKLLEIDYMNLKNKIETNIDYLNKERQAIETFYQKDLMNDINALKSDLYFEEDRVKLNAELDHIELNSQLLQKDLNVIHAKIHFFFNQVYLIYNLEHHLMSELVNLYNLPAHPEDVKTFISLMLNIFKDLKAVKEGIKSTFLLDIKIFHDMKIEVITGQKYNADVAELEMKLQKTVDKHNVDKSKSNLIIEKIHTQIEVLGNNVDKLQSSINRLEIQKLESDQKKHTKALQNEIDAFVKQINSIEMEMNALYKEIDKHQKPIDKINNEIQSLELKFELEKKALHSSQAIEAKLYFQQNNFYVNFMKKLTHLFNTYEAKFLVITQKISQPIYLTDVLIKDAQKNFIKLEDLFEKQSNQYYQHLIAHSIEVFDKLTLEHNALRQLSNKAMYKNIDKNKKDLVVNTQNKAQLILKHNQNLSQLKIEENTYISTLAYNLGKEKQPKIMDLRNQIKDIETHILALEEKLKNELQLIDLNLNEALTHMASDHKKLIAKNQEVYLKNVQKANEAIESKLKNLKQLEESTKNKNVLLISRFSSAENKLKDTLKEKLASYKEQRSKNDLIFQKKIDTLMNELHSLYTKHDNLINEETKNSKLLANQIDKDERKTLEKNILDAKKSYEFKTKSLKL